MNKIMMTYNRFNKTKLKLETVKSEINEGSKFRDNSNRFLYINKNDSLSWYMNLGEAYFDIIVQSDGCLGIGKGLNTESIEISESSSDIKDYWLHITLKDLTQIDIFVDIILDIIEYSDEARDGKEGFSLIVDRFLMWKNMMKHKGENKSVAKGIIGELITIIRLLDQGLSSEEIINGWGGPENVQQDFILSNFWVETKTTGVNASTITINSLGQLDKEDLPGYLYLVKITENSSNNAICVGDLYSLICEKLKNNNDFSSILLFKKKMNEFEYDRFCLSSYKCVINEEKVFSVKDDFPRLFNKYQMTGIKTVHYELLLSVIEKWFEKEGCSVWMK